MQATVIKINKSDKGTWMDVQGMDGKISMLVPKEMNISALQEGSKADFVFENKTSAAGKRYSMLRSFAFEGGAPQGAASTPVTKNGLSEPELRFISNVVGNAVTQKFIMSPTDIKFWVGEALDALANPKRLPAGDDYK